MTRPIRWLVTLVAPLLLASCIVTPGKFVSTLDIRADRSFTFTYVGEVVLMKSKSSTGFSDPDGPQSDEQNWQDDEGEPLMLKIAAPSAAAPKPGSGENFDDTPEEAAQLRTIVEALSREYGFRSVRAIGNRRLAIDYRIGGRLDHAFVFPFNPDGNVVLPFLAIELRGKDKVRIKAPGFANEQSAAGAMGAGGMGGLGGGLGGSGLPGMGADAESALDGKFTLTTNGGIVSQNQEEGVQTLPDGTKSVAWRATPQTKDAPMAVLKLDPLP